MLLLLAAQQFSTGIGLRASCQHAAEKALGGGRYVMVPLRSIARQLCRRKTAGGGGFMRHLLSWRRGSRVSIVCAARQADFLLIHAFFRRWDHCVRMSSTGSHTGTCDRCCKSSAGAALAQMAEDRIECGAPCPVETRPFI
jgi:hypothetical protein